MHQSQFDKRLGFDKLSFFIMAGRSTRQNVMLKKSKLFQDLMPKNK